MVTYSDVTTQIMYGTELTYGTEVTADSYFGRITGFNFDRTNNLIKDYDIGNRAVQNFLLGGFGITGTVNFDIIDFDVFEEILGSRTGSGTGADPYIYTRGNSISSITIETARRGTTDMNFTITGAKCNQAVINFSTGETMKCTSNWTAQTVKEDSSIQAYTTPTTNPFTYLQGSIERSDVAISGIQSGSITVTNNLIENREIGDRLMTDLFVGQFDIAFELSMYLDSGMATTFFSDAYGQVVGSGPINSGSGLLTGSTIDLEISDGSNRIVTIALGTATINNWTPAVNMGNNMCTLTISGFAKTITITEQQQA